MAQQILFEDESILVINKAVGESIVGGVLALPNDVSGIEISMKPGYQADLLQYRVTYLAWIEGHLPLENERFDDWQWTKVHTVYQTTLVRMTTNHLSAVEIQSAWQSFGHPIIDVENNQGQHIASSRLLLHASAIQLRLPITKQQIEIGAPIPKNFPRNFKPNQGASR
ncbi:hypothetical protein H9L19_01610 [Weissella diestrammenae]|uniref:Uncharacterized protein n=1 Tax=Weissella diestrammenae TaxID=1162633 RepID=A0A7G9T675_9LACO|nr:hypothetical protein [Weissella diestrammenae]QNN75600.1 hypothetical protein H9L19_01610 [Weissella diestrammenae]